MAYSFPFFFPLKENLGRSDCERVVRNVPTSYLTSIHVNHNVLIHNTLNNVIQYSKNFHLLSPAIYIQSPQGVNPKLNIVVPL